MKKLLYILMFVILTNFVSASCNGNFDILDSGNSNQNTFYPGDSVFISGQRFPANSALNYKIINLPAEQIISGEVFTDNEGNLNSINIWDIPLDYENLGEHKVEINYDGCRKSKNLKVELYEVPEFSSLGVVLAGALSLLGIFVLRKY